MNGFRTAGGNARPRVKVISRGRKDDVSTNNLWRCCLCRSFLPVRAGHRFQQTYICIFHLSSKMKQAGPLRVMKCRHLIKCFTVVCPHLRKTGLLAVLTKAIKIFIHHEKPVATKWKGKNSPVRDWRSTPLEWLSSSRDLDLDLGSSHTAYHRASVIDLCLHTKFRWNQKNFFSAQTNRRE